MQPTPLYATLPPASRAPQVMRTDCTYTFVYFSSNVDLHLWKIVRLPGGQSVDMRSVRASGHQHVMRPCLRRPRPRTFVRP